MKPFHWGPHGKGKIPLARFTVEARSWMMGSHRNNWYDLGFREQVWPSPRAGSFLRRMKHTGGILMRTSCHPRLFKTLQAWPLRPIHSFFPNAKINHVLHKALSFQYLFSHNFLSAPLLQHWVERAHSPDDHCWFLPIVWISSLTVITTLCTLDLGHQRDPPTVSSSRESNSLPQSYWL